MLLFLGIGAVLYPHVRPPGPDDHLLTDWALACRGKQRPDGTAVARQRGK